MSSASAAVLRCDIVGFTLLTDRMVKSGIAGAEQLADVMNQVINRMAEIAWTLGGELVNWEGDAGTFVWFAQVKLPLDEATVLAIQAASITHREAESWLVDGAPMLFRSAVSCGSLSHFEIGGKDDEWHALLAGPALSDVNSAEKTAAPGETVISRAAFALVGGRCQCISLDGERRGSWASSGLPTRPRRRLLPATSHREFCGKLYLRFCSAAAISRPRGPGNSVW